MERTKRIKFWLDDKELALIDKKAKKDGLSRSEFLRKMINEAEVIPATDIDYTFYKEEYRRLGKILNAYVKEVNTTGELNFEAVDHVVSEIRTLSEKMLTEMREKTPQLGKGWC